MLARGIDRYYLLTSGKSNSLAASLEILSYLRQQGLRGEVLHGNNTYVASRIQTLAAVQEARARLKDMRIGVIGQPSDWLIASHMDPMALLDKLGVRMEEVPRPRASPLRRSRSWTARSGTPIPAPCRSIRP